MSSIKFIPPQTGEVDKYTTRANRQDPLWLLVKDTFILIKNLRFLPLLFLPLKSEAEKQNAASPTTPTDKKQNPFCSFLNLGIQILLALLELVFLILFVPALISLPGIIFFAVAVLCFLLIKVIAWPTQGPRILLSNMDTRTTQLAAQHQHERWIFINGICTGTSGLQENIDRLSLLFGRSVTGVHNQSYGIIGDIVECILQRCLDYKTMDVRVAFEVIKHVLADPGTKKVVLVAHSQGGIVASMVLDELFCEVPAELISKLEIYTFGSAASHFHNPFTSSSPSSTLFPSPMPTIIKHIEHYANEKDMVPRWGVLYATCELLTSRYAGKVFVRMGATGHLFGSHYLDPIFGNRPGFRVRERGDGGAGERERVDEVAMGRQRIKVSRVRDGRNGYAPGTTNGYIDDGITANGHTLPNPINDQNEAGEDGFLNAFANVDEETWHRRKRARLRPLKPLKANTQARMALPYGDGDGEVDGDGDEEEQREIIEYRGKKVRGLSRLWLYLGGESPRDW